MLPSSFATCAPSDELKSPSTTLLPALANLSTVALPNPEAPPVTKATAFCKYKMLLYNSECIKLIENHLEHFHKSRIKN